MHLQRPDRRRRLSVALPAIALLLIAVLAGWPSTPARGAAAAHPAAYAASGFVAMGFAIGYQMPVNPPWGDVTQLDLFPLQTTKGTALDTSQLAGVNVPAFTAAAHAHGVQALISIGGSSDQNWQYACTGSNRAGFVSNLVSYMQSNGFDGIDLDIEDDLWASIGPPDTDMTACIEAISTAARAVKTQAGNVPRISADVITNWEGPWFTPSAAYVDQFNLMTYGDTTGGSLQADVADTESQGLPAAKLVPGIDVIDSPATSNQCGPFASYAQANGLMGAFVFDASTDEAHGYPCFSQFASYVGGGGSPTPTPSPSPSPSPSPTPSPAPAPTFTAAPAVFGSVAFKGTAGSNVVLKWIARDPSGRTVTTATRAETSMPSGYVTVSKTFAAPGEASGTVLTLEAQVLDGVTGAVLYDEKNAETVTVP